jgi:tetratricopeptide (TPR) repeat protein
LILGEYGYDREAIACFARAGQLSPRSPRWPYLQGLYEIGFDLDKAAALLQRSAELETSVAAPRLLLGKTLLRIGQVDEAHQQFQYVLERDPENAQALLGMGRVAIERGDFASARDYLKQSVALAGRIQETHSLLANIYQRLGEETLANKQLTLAKSLSSKSHFPDPYNHLDETLRGHKFVILRARSLIAENRAAKAIDLLKELPQTADGAATTNACLGNAYLKLGEFDSAVSCYREALRLKPDSVEVLNALGAALEDHGDFGTAAAEFRKVIALKRDAAAHYHLAQCLEKEHRNEDAISEYKAAARIQPGFALAHKALGMLLQASGQDAEAVASLTQASKLLPEDQEIRRSMEVSRARIDESKMRSNKP